MKRILTISLSLKNAYRINSILYMLQQTPIIRDYEKKSVKIISSNEL